jgi:RimJ/RimL family protein N-acetyltransferase
LQPVIKSVETSKGKIVVRDASLADAERYRELRLLALKESPTAFSADYEENARQSMSYWKNRLKPDEHGIIFIAEYEKQLIGMIGIRKGDSSKTKHSAGIWGVYVHPDWRGLRIAEGLIELCCEWAKLREVQIAKLAVVATNKSAIRLYERSGFTIYGTEPNALRVQGRYYDELYMSRPLIDP